MNERIAMVAAVVAVGSVVARGATGAPVPLPSARVELPAVLRGMPGGERELAGVTWDIDPGRGVRVEGRAAVGIPVGRAAATLFFLQTLEPGPEVRAWQRAAVDAKAKGEKPSDPPVALRYDVRYADGQTVEIPVRFGEGIHALLRDDFFTREDGFYADLLWARVAWGAPTFARPGERATVYALRWPNPRPEQAIESVTARGVGAGTAWLLAVSAGGALPVGRNFYVAPDGNDSAAGDFDRPFASLHRAVSDLRPGDSVYLRGGHYAMDRRVRLVASGAEGAWITVSAYPGGETPVLDFSGFAAQGETPIKDWTPLASPVLGLGGQSCVRVQGLHVENSIAYGIATGGGTHQEVLFNTVYRTYHTGIWGTGKGVRVIGNTLIRTCDTRTFYTFVERYPHLLESAFMQSLKKGHDARRRFRHECLDIGSSGSEDCEAAYNEVAHGDKEGIDCKGGPRGVRIHHNFVHHVTMWTGIYVDAWSQLMRDIEVDHNIVWRTAGTGISVASEGGSGFENVNVHHNVVLENGFSGLLLSACNQDGFKKNVRFEHNTVLNNGTNAKNRNAQGGLHIGSDQAENIVVRNNLFAGNRDYAIARNIGKSPAEMGIAIAYNLIDPPAAAGTKVFPDADPAGDQRLLKWFHEPGGNAVHGAPLFADAANSNFRPAPGSPAIGAGRTADGAACDVGAFAAEGPQVLALQSFLDPASERRIVGLWKRAMAIEGVRCAYALGADPHVTTGSWKVPPERLGGTAAALEALRGELRPVALRFRLASKPDASGGTDYWLEPEATPELLAFHERANRLPGFDFERFRAIDVPGQWKPHLTLFTVPAGQEEAGAPILEDLRRITDGRIASVGLVLFGPIRNLARLDLSAD